MDTKKSISAKTRLTVRKKIKNHKKLQITANSINKGYSTILGPLHTLPDFLIIGSAKCGTSSLYEYLIKHPNIESAIGKEINYFDMQYEKGINWYKTYFPSLIHKKISKNIFHKKLITGEATPRYIDHPLAIKRIKNNLPNIKLIVMLRNPVDRAYSHWNMMVTHKHENLSFEDAIEQEEKRISSLYEKMNMNKKFYSKEYFWYGYLERSTYINKLKRWFEYFPRKQFLILKSEELFIKPDTTYKKVLDFLKLEKLDLENYKTYRKGKYKKIEMNSETRKKLIEYFRPHNSELYKLLNENFGWDK